MHPGHMNIPKDYWSITKYRATLGHKANHSFKKDNAYFGHVSHPIFGQIRCLTAKKDIQKDEEILVNYGYGAKSINVPPWYIEAYERDIGPYPPKVELQKKQRTNRK